MLKKIIWGIPFLAVAIVSAVVTVLTMNVHGVEAKSSNANAPGQNLLSGIPAGPSTTDRVDA